MFCGQSVVLHSGSLFDHVPLSCVPPITSHGFDGLMATLMNWSVFRFRSMCVMVVGTWDSIRLQFARLAAPSSGRSFELQRADRSPNVPSVRMTPPSDPSKIWVGFDGLIAIACWSGWMLSGAHAQAFAGAMPPNAASPAGPSPHQLAGWSCMSYVRSVNVRFPAVPGAEASGSPAVVEY